MPRGRKAAPVEEKSATVDLGALQREMQQIAEDTNQLKEQEKDLARRKAEVEKRMAKALKELGILDVISPRAASAEPKRAGRRPGRAAKKSEGNGVQKRVSGKRYTDEEKQSAVAFVDQAVQSGSSITDAISDYNKQNKPRGKAPMNYQSLLRWRS